MGSGFRNLRTNGTTSNDNLRAGNHVYIIDIQYGVVRTIKQIVVSCYSTEFTATIDITHNPWRTADGQFSALCIAQFLPVNITRLSWCGDGGSVYLRTASHTACKHITTLRMLQSVGISGRVTLCCSGCVVFSIWNVVIVLPRSQITDVCWHICVLIHVTYRTATDVDNDMTST